MFNFIFNYANSWYYYMFPKEPPILEITPLPKSPKILALPRPPLKRRRTLGVDFVHYNLPRL